MYERLYGGRPATTYVDLHTNDTGLRVEELYDGALCVAGRAVTGTHFATLVPPYQYPAGTRLMDAACSKLQNKTKIVKIGSLEAKISLKLACTTSLRATLWLFSRIFTPIEHSQAFIEHLSSSTEVLNCVN